MSILQGADASISWDSTIFRIIYPVPASTTFLFAAKISNSGVLFPHDRAQRFLEIPHLPLMHQEKI
jgi:hypothetical protein